MKKALLMAPMGSVHRRFNHVNISALLSLGYEVHLLANFENGDGAEQQNTEYMKIAENRGIIVHSIPYARHSLIKNLKNILLTKKLLKTEHFDIVHTHTETGGLILRLCGKRKASAYVYTSHGFSFYKGSPLLNQLLYRPIEKWLCSGMNINIAINEEDFEVQNKWNKNTSRFVHGIGLNLQRFEKDNHHNDTIRKEFGIQENTKIILSIGELDDNKNHTVVIEAISAIKDIDVCYVICGFGPNKDKLIRLSEKLGVKDKVIFAGYRKDIPSIISASDLFVFPSYHEGLPVALMEAMAGGLPIVASNIRGVNDLIQNEVNGFLVSPHNRDGFENKIEILLNENVLATKFGLKSRNIIEQYSSSKVYDELRSIYLEV